MFGLANQCPDRSGWLRPSATMQKKTQIPLVFLKRKRNSLTKQKLFDVLGQGWDENPQVHVGSVVVKTAFSYTPLIS